VAQTSRPGRNCRGHYVGLCASRRQDDKMNGLRVYINPHVKETCGGFGVFIAGVRMARTIAGPLKSR